MNAYKVLRLIMLFYCDQFENVIRIHCISIFLKARNLYVTRLKIKEWILSQLTTKNYDEALIKIKRKQADMLDHFSFIYI